MPETIEISQRTDLFDNAVEFIWGAFGNKDNFEFYRDCMDHSRGAANPLPRFYLALENERIIGCCALLVNDLISRQDLLPWLACLYIVPERRGNKLGSRLLSRGVAEASAKGFPNVYLCTDLDGYYEKYGWSFFAHAYMMWGIKTKIYRIATAAG